MMRRLIIALCAWLALLPAFAADIALSGYQYRFFGYTYPENRVVSSYWTDTLDLAACQDYVNAYAAASPGSQPKNASVSGSTCSFQYFLVVANTWYNNHGEADSRVAVCPSNSTTVPGGCDCNSGYVASGGQCVQQAQCTPPFVYDPDTNGCFQPCLSSAGKTGSTLLVFKFQGISTAKQLVPLIGRKMTANATNDAGYSCAVETTISTCGLLGTEATCTGHELRFTGDPAVDDSNEFTPVPTTKDDVQSIQNGNCSASMNGQTVYVPCSGTATGTDSSKTDATGTTSTTGTTSSSTSSDGTTSTTDSRTTTNADGSTSTTTTTCTGNTCTSTTTTTDAQGTTTGTKTTTDTKEAFCIENPDAPICKRSTFSAAPCGTTPSCEGDAIQCAIVRKQYEDHCALWGKDDDPNSAANQAINGTDPNSASAMQAAASVVNLPSSFDTSGYGWSRACPADTEIDLGPMGGTLKLPYSKVCGLLNVLSVAAVGITLLAAAVWVVKG